MDLNRLIYSIELLANPQGKAKQDLLNASLFCDNFVLEQMNNVHEFFNLITLDQFKASL